MASEEDVTSDSLDMKVTKIPQNLQKYLKTKVAEYITKSKDVSMEIHQSTGQTTKLVMSVGKDSGRKPAFAGSENETNVKDTRTISVRNLPASVDEDLLEVFFESKKKYGGGPVESVKIFEDRNAAIVKFCDESSVQAVLEKKPIIFGKRELIIEPFRELIADTETVSQVDIKGLSKAFTDDLIKEYFDCVLPLPLSGPEIANMLKVGVRVVRGRDWKYGDQDGGGVGTVTLKGFVLLKGRVCVKWDNGVEGSYRMGQDGCYDLHLAS